MPKVIYVAHDGEKTELEVAIDNNVMMAAVFDGVSGIDGMCGGCLACATCHVYVDDAWAQRLPSIGEDEDTLLSQVASERKSTSRLSCQLVMTAELDGITVHMPQSQ
jgi:ferredoxin, 2Fe-2S